MKHAAKKAKPRKRSTPGRDRLMAFIEREELKHALRDLLAYFDRRTDSGWTYADIKRLGEIRKLSQ